VKLHWVTDYFGVGNSYGYSIHNSKAKEACERLGVVMDASSDVAFHVTPPHMFEPVPGKKNIAYAAWEASQLPECFRILERADAVCLTASFLVEPFRKLLPGKPIYHVPLGVDSDLFRYVDRNDAKRRPIYGGPKHRPFRFLWLGAPNARKGPLHVLEAWRAFADSPNCELYLKTTFPQGEHDQPPGIKRIGNIIFDSRRVPATELAGIYAHSHAFAFPSVGEGFGLTLGEAMATGLPCVYTPATAMLDLAPPDELVGYPIKYDLKWEDWSWTGVDEALERSYQLQAQLATPDTYDLALQMGKVMSDWQQALARGRKAARRIREHFTWEKCGRKLIEVVESIS